MAARHAAGGSGRTRAAGRPRKRRHPARSARVLTVGISASAVLALTAVMGMSARGATTTPTDTVLLSSNGAAQSSGAGPAAAPTSATPSATPTWPTPVVVVVHRKARAHHAASHAKAGTSSASSGTSGSSTSSTSTSTHRTKASSHRTTKPTGGGSGTSTSGGTHIPPATPAPTPTHTTAPTPTTTHGTTGGSH